MESFASLMKGADDGPVIVPGKSDQSLLMQLIEQKKKPFMPPPKKGKKLSPEEIELIRGWIDGGAHAPAPGEQIAVQAAPKIQPKVTPLRSIYAIGYAAKQKTLAVARHGMVELYSAESRGLLRRLEGHHGNVNAVLFSPDGMTLAAAAGEPGVMGEVRLWSLADGKLIRTFEGHKDAIYAMAISPNGKVLATGSYDQKIILWNIDTAKPIRELEGHNGAVFGLSFRADGKVLASASADRTVKLWEVETGKRLDTLSESLKELNTVAFSPDGTRVAAGGVDNRIRVWRISAQATEGTNSIQYAQFAHEGAILRLAWSSDGKRILSSADDRTVKLWNAETMTEQLALPMQTDWPAALAFAMEDKAVVIGRLDGTLAYYDATSSKDLPPPKPEAVAVEPHGVERGQIAKLKITGKNLAVIATATLRNSKAKAEIVNSEGIGDVAWINLTTPADLLPGTYDLTVAGPGGESGALKVYIDNLPQAQEKEPNDLAANATSASLPVSFWGQLNQRGDVDHFAFTADAGQKLVFDVAARRLGSKADIVLAVLDSTGKVMASSNQFGDDRDPLLTFTVPSTGRYIVRVTDLAAAASPEHFYRLSVGTFPYVAGVYPLAIAPDAETQVQLIGYNLPTDAFVNIKAGSAEEMDVPIDANRYRSRRAMKVLVGSGPEPMEIEPNDRPEQAMKISMPGSVNGRIWAAQGQGNDVDLYRFDAKAGQTLVAETMASRRGSPVDTKIEVLHPDGRPVERLLLRAVRDSAITFRPIDAGAGGARLVNWEEMELNQYLYMQGEVAKLFLAPRGPDSEFGFYTSAGRRHCYFDTSATAHSLDEHCYIVEPQKPGTKLPSTGLPVFPLYYANDDDGRRQLGSDSRLYFTAPADGAYLIRVSDVRGFGGDRFAYRLTVRPAKPDFNVTLDGANPTVPIASGRSFSVRADRIDEFDGPIRIDITGLPPGFVVSTPLLIEAGHESAQGTIFALPNAPQPTKENWSQTKVTATAVLEGKEAIKPVNDLAKIALAGGKPALLVALEPYLGPASTKPSTDQTKIPEITVAPGRLVPAMLYIQRNGTTGPITFDVENLPHGVIVADIGLNGVLIPENQSERQIFISCAPGVADMDRLCYAKAREAGNPASRPVMLHVRRPAQQASKP